jgi:hypothetical protein
VVPIYRVSGVLSEHFDRYLERYVAPQPQIKNDSYPLLRKGDTELDFLYNSLKVVSMIATGAFGALGLLTKYRDDRGKITKWGKIALGGILVSSGISLGLYILETSRAKAAAIRAQAEAKATSQKLETILFNAQLSAEQQKTSLAETNILKSGLEKTLDRSDHIAKQMEESLAAQQSVLIGNKRILGGVTNTVQKQSQLLNLNTSTLNEVSRGLYPIKNVTISYAIQVPMDHLQVKSYVTRVQKELNTYAHAGSPIIDERTVDSDRNLISISFGRKSPLAPDITTEHLAYWLLDYFTIELWFYKTPVTFREVHPRKGGALNQPDLKLSVSASLYDGNQWIEYNVKSKEFALETRKVVSDPHNWESSGKIIGIPDLLGSEMFVVFPFERQSGADVSINKYLNEIRKGFDLESLFVELADGHSFVFAKEDLQRHIDEDGYPMYSFRFPETSDGLRKLER